MHKSTPVEFIMTVVNRLVAPEQIIPAQYEQVVLVSKEDGEELSSLQKSTAPEYRNGSLDLIHIVVAAAILSPVMLKLTGKPLPVILLADWTVLPAGLLLFAYVILVCQQFRVHSKWVAWVDSCSPILRTEKILMSNGWDGEGNLPKWEVKNSDISAESDDVELLDTPIDWNDQVRV